MINASGAFRQALANGYRNYIERAVIKLSDGTNLTLDNSNLWQGGFTIEDAVSGSEDSFSSLGSAIINSATLVINNVQDDFSQYDFTGASAILYVGLEIDGTREMLKKGTYTVDEATYNGVLITLKLFDYMTEFDRPYSESTLKYPASCDTIIRDTCTKCGMTLSASSANFPHKDTVIQSRPDDDKEMTFREIISYVATVCGCFAKVNVDGNLELRWFNQDLLERLAQGYDGGQFDANTPYSTGDSVDGGSFNPWNDGNVVDDGDFRARNGVHYISSLYSSNISVDDVVITGVTVEYEVENDGSKEIIVDTIGTDDYAVKVSKNPFITADNVETIKSRLGEQLIGLKFRKASVSHGSDPTIEAGDVAFVIDRKNNVYPILISRTVFSVGSSQKTVCGASTPKRNSASRFTEQTKSYATLRRELKNQKTEYDKALEDLAEDIANANGLYETQVETESGGYITYMHNKTRLEDSDIQIVISDVGVTVTANGTAEQPTWYGLRVNGELIASILNTVGVNADWINTGQLVITKNGKEMFFADVDTGTVRITGDSVSITAGDPIDKAISDMAEDLGDQIDGKAETWYQTSDPSTAWTTTELKNQHKGDLWYNSTSTVQKYYRWSGTVWQEVTSTPPTAVFDEIDGKAQIFTSQPKPPYDVGDLWFNSSSSSIMVCMTARTSGSYVSSDWQKRDKYTDDSAVTTLNNSLTQQEIFNRLTNNKANQGIYIENGNLYINASMIHTGTFSADYIYGGTLKLGGTATGTGGNGSLVIYNSSGTEIGRWDKDGISVKSGSITGGTINGATITVGGSNNASGSLVVKNAAGTQIGKWDKDGISITSGSINLGSGAFQVTSDGIATISKGSLKISDATHSSRYAQITGGHICSYADGQHLDIYEALLTGYEGSSPTGVLDLSAQYTSGGSHVALKSYGTLHLQASSILFENLGGTSLGHTGDLPVSSGYNYTIHVTNGIITGWS